MREHFFAFAEKSRVKTHRWPDAAFGVARRLDSMFETVVQPTVRSS
jgi:hypothetical protein